MKNIVVTFFSAILCSSLLLADTETLTRTELDVPSEVSTSTEQTLNAHSADQLASLRAQVAQQVEQIHNILITLCETVEASQLSSKEELCRELALMRDCMQTIAQTLPDMDKQALAHLIELNTIVLNQLQEQLIDGAISGLCNFTAAQFTTPKQQTRSFITIEQLQEKVAQLHNQIQEIWVLTTSASLAVYSEATQQASSSLWEKTKNNKNTIIASLSALLAAGLFYKSYDTIKPSEWINRLMSYSLMGLYIIRQKKDADIKPLAEKWFGENSFLTESIINAKYYVGSPKEKLPAVHIIARNDMTAQEQIKWAEDNNCAVLKIEKGRDYNVVKDFFDLEDGLFKLPVSFFFAYRIKEDMFALSNYLEALTKGSCDGFFCTTRRAHKR